MTKDEAIKVLEMVEAHGLAKEAKEIAIKALKTEAIPVEFIRDLHKEAIAYRDRLDPVWQNRSWNRADEQAIGINSVLQAWDDRHGWGKEE